MLAYTYVSKGDFRLMEKPEPVLEDGKDAIVRVELASICTSDLHIRHGAVPRAVPGITVGHEMVGTVETVGYKTLCAETGVGEPTLRDIVSELVRPGRDMRDELPPPLLRSDVMGMEDLKPGMELLGTVRNVIDFGAFVDIGVHQDGLVHVSQLSEKFIKHPSQAVHVGDVVRVRVLDVDLKKKRIALTMKQVKQPQ